MNAIATLRRWRHGRLKALGPLWTLLGRGYRLARRAWPGKPVTQRIGPYGPFLLQPEFAFSNFENWGGAHNSGFAACIEACRGKSCVFDVGGHIGLVTLPMSRAVAPAGRVHTFEPAAVNARILRRHLADNRIDNVEVIESLVGRSDEEQVDFFEDREASGMNALAVKRDEHRYERTRRRQLSLDSFCSSRGLSPEVIKIDVEGAEVQVLQGARETLRRCRPRIYLSVHPAHLKLLGSSTDDLLALIESSGYACREIGGSPVQTFRLDEYLLLPTETRTAC
jgi:FkbM family methyltransferase